MCIFRAKQSLGAFPLALGTLREQTLLGEHQELRAQRSTAGCTQQNPDRLSTAAGNIAESGTTATALS